MSHTPTPDPARDLPDAGHSHASRGEHPPKGDTPMRSSAAERLIIEEPAPKASRRRHAETGDDFSIPAIATRAAQLSDPTASELAGLFHSARLSANHVNAAAASAQAEANAFYPPPPAAILSPNGRPERPNADWPAWKHSAYALWDRQRELIDRGLGVDGAEKVAADATRLRDDLGNRALSTPARSMDDVREKLAVVGWMLDLDAIEAEEAGRIIFRMSAEFGELLPS